MDKPPVPYPRLEGNETCDVIVIGSGIAGLSTAYELTLRGFSVIVVDRGPIARGISARTSAHLTTACDDFYHQFIAIRGQEAGRLHFDSHQAAVERIGEIQAGEAIDCGFARLDAFLFLAGKTEPEVLDRELDAVRSVGLEAQWVDGSKLRHRLSDGPCLLIPDQGRFHPLAYLDGLAARLVARGAKIYADTIVTGVAEQNSGGAIVTTRYGHRVSAEFAVIATNTPINDKLTIHAKQAPFRTYVVAGPVPRGAIADSLYWDTEDPYHYVRLHPWGEYDLLLVGGEDHRSGQADDAAWRLVKLEQWARVRFPELGQVTYRWSGQVIDTIDYAAFIGLNPGNKSIYVVSGDSGQGITHGVAGSLLLTGLIQNGHHPWADVYAPERKPTRAATNFVSSTLDVVKNLAEHVTGGEVSSEDDLLPGRGGILREGLHKVAVSRDEAGTIHRRSATCSHVGCLVHWNSFEQCWDCPCHGSHFAPDGSALNAPAIEPLASVEEKLSLSEREKA